MGFIRGGLVTILGIILFFSFISMNAFLTLTTSLSYDNVNEELSNVTEKILQKDINLTKKIDDTFYFMQIYCRNNKTEYTIEEKNYNFTIPCEIIENGKESIFKNIIENTTKTFYFQEYNCSFWECIKETKYPFFLISKKSKDYWSNKLYLSLITIAMIIAITFILIEQKINLPLIIGGLLGISALPFAKLNSLLSIINNNIIQFFTIFFTTSYTIFKISLITGIIIFAIGIAIRFLNLDLLKKKFSKEEVKEIIKKEISKEKKEKKKNV